MKKIFILVFTIITVVLGSCIFSMNDDYDKDVGGNGAAYNITGKFIKPNGTVVAGLTVTLVSGEIDRTAVTNENGEYIFEDVPAGSYTVTPITTVHTQSGVITVTNRDVSFGTNSGVCSTCHSQ